MKKPVIKGNTISVPSDQEYLADVDSFLEGLLRGFGADESVIADVAISVSEVVNNAMVHGNKSAPDKSVFVTIGRVDSEVTITVKDEGAGFNPDEVADPLAQENLLKEVGRGLFIVRSLMDKVEVATADGGTLVTMVKDIG